MSHNILARLGAFRKKFITHKISDGEAEHEFRFYAPRFGSIATGRTRELVEPLIQSATAIWTGGRSATQTQQIKYGDDGRPLEAMVMSQDEDTMRAVEEQRRAAISDAFGVLFSDTHRHLLGELLADSLRDDFPARTDPEFDAIVKKFMDDTDFGLMVQFITGYFKALLPFMDSAGNLIPSGLRELVAKAAGDQVEGGEESSVPQIPKLVTTPTPTEP
jgi:hypothetical protein